MGIDSNNIAFAVSSALPDGNGGFTPCPDLLTPEEAIRFLRIDTLNRKHPLKTLAYYIEKGDLEPTRIGGKNFYTRDNLKSFQKKMTEKGFERRKHGANSERRKRQKVLEGVKR